MIAPTRKGGAGWTDALTRWQRGPHGDAEAQLPSRTANLPAWFWQAIRYSVVGITNTGVDATLYLLLTHWLGLGSLKVLAKGISYTVGTVNSFHWNRSWTFRSTARVAIVFVPFLLTSLAALVINASAMYVCLELFDQRELPALALATAITLLWNFGVTKFLIFRR